MQDPLHFEEERPQKSRVVVTGATGFVGRHLCTLLRESGFDVHGLVRRDVLDHETEYHRIDFRKGNEVRYFLETLNPDFIVHLVALSNPARNLDEFDAQYENTILPAIQVARLSPTSVKLAIFCGSCEEYGNGPTPFQEDQQLLSFSPYGWAKIAAFQAATMIARQRDLPWCWVRPFPTFGPGQGADRFIGSVIKGCLDGDNVPLTTGEESRDFIYVKDLCGMFLKLLQKPDLAKGAILNLGTGAPQKLKDVAKLIQEKVGRGTINFGGLPTRDNEATDFYCSMTRFESLYGPLNLTPFADAVLETIKFALENPVGEQAA